MLIESALAALRQILSPALRGILWKSIGLTLGFLVALWVALTQGFNYYLRTYPLSERYPLVDTLAFFLAGAGLLVLLVYLLPAITALVAGLFLDDAAEAVERRDFPADPPGRALPLASSIGYGLRFAGLALVVNIAALALFFVPVINVGVFFAANSYLLGREYFEMAAARQRPMKEAAAMRAHYGLRIWLAGALIAALLLVPVLNLLTPLFGIALMVHVHKRLSARPPGGR